MECMSHDPDEISRAFKKHCSKCGAWNQVIVHRMPTDGDWDEAHPYFCAECGHQLGTGRGFRISVEKDRD
jgi:DNA-directed RNA polymerase subunit M/transcription elongation factor TFIIS